MKTNPGYLNKNLEEMQTLFRLDPYPSLLKRKEILSKIKEILIENESRFVEALSKDYGYRSEEDTILAEIIPTISYIKYTSKMIKKWMKKERRNSTITLFPSKVEVHYQPLGVVGIIVPWNFPISLSINPAVSAIGAGNRVMIKLSEYTPNLNKVIIETFSTLKEYIRFYEGETEVASKFSSLPFDYLLFTGSTSVGRKVLEAAARNLTPVTLELGGKSPTIITEEAHMNSAIDNIIFGKTLNSGQICVAPDYVFIHYSIKNKFIRKFKEKVKELYTNDKKSLTYIINEVHCKRLRGYIEDAKEKGGHVIEPIKSSIERIIYPTLILDVNEDMSIMKEEVFGPLLPVMTYEEIEEVIDYINDKPKPLALYIMSENKEEIDKILKNTSSGGVCINDTVMHVGIEDAPFGGVGESGMGQYHGREGFLTFSKAKTLLISKSYIPRNKFFLKYKKTLVKYFRILFLRWL